MTSVTSLPEIGESYTTAGGRTAYRVEPSQYGPSILATNLAREKKARQPRKGKQAPVLLTAWQRGEALLSRGYTVDPMPQYLCYEVTGGTAPYHVCLDATSTAYGCSCPDGIMRGDKRPCKHALACMVSLWQWAEAEGDVEQYADIFEEIGILALRAGARTAAPETVTAPDTASKNPDDRGECGELDVETMTRCDGRRIVHYETFAGQIGYPVWVCQKCGWRQAK